MDVSSDPYELKLLQMFQSCDTERCGLLNEVALRRLCELLELNDKGKVLIASLAADTLKVRVSFESFKEALLNFLGTELDLGRSDVKNSVAELDARNAERVLIISDSVDTYIDSPPDSSEREVSPKLIVGAKKYGRRSRPQTNELGNFSTSDSEPEVAEESLPTECYDNNVVQRCSSQTDITSGRRRRPPAFTGSKLKRCSSLPAQRISQKSTKSLTTNRSAQTTLNASVLASKQKQPLSSSVESLDTPAVLETLSASSLIDIWERANIVNGKSILLALGFDEGEINLVQLNKVLEEEVRTGDEEPPLTLLRAFMALQSHELATLRQNFRQLSDENRKLRSDNHEANRRAAMLALEIDERHATIEDTTKEEIRKLEQRHAGVVRDLTARMTSDRENWLNLNARLEAQIKSFEREEIRLKTEVELVRRENSELEADQQKFQRQITELLEKNILLNREIAELEDNTRRDDSSTGEKKSSEDELLHLIEKISNLQTENKNLRDKNDELVAEVENLNFELNRAKSKNNKKLSVSEIEMENSEQCGTSTTATKRRGDSPSKVRTPEESPRLGKLRKCTDGHESDSSGEWLALNSELKSSTGEVSEDIAALKQRIIKLEQLKDAVQSDERCKELEVSLEQMQRAYEDCEDYWQGKLAEERQLFEKERQIYEEEQQESDKKFTELMEKVREYEEQFSKDGRLSPIEEKDNLEQQYIELEAEAEEIRENARKIFAEKAREIEALQGEIEDLRQRLGESVEILTGASELKSEAAAAAQHTTQNPQSPASSPISYLWHQSTIQDPVKSSSLSLVSLSSPSKQASRNNLTTSETAIFSTTPADTISSSPIVSPIQKPGASKTSKSDCGEVADCDTSSTTSGRSFETHSVTSTTGVQVEKNATSREQSNASPSPSGSKIKEELKRLKFFEISLKEQIKDLSLQRDGLVMELQQLQEARPVLEKAYARTTHPTLIQRVSQLELKNRHLQNVIKQQQLYTESLMQQSWRQHQMELTDLHGKIEGQGAMIAEQTQRLQNADVLVKDLYVENSHLTATVQRLEQQRVRATFVHQQRQPLPMHGLSGMP